MKWFEGSIPEAINLSKQRGSLFLVYVYGTDEQSEKMTTTLNSKGVEEVLETNGGVALKLLSTSQDCKFFSQIYPVVVVPSVFCIGDNGVPLEVIGGFLTEEECVQKLQHVQQTHITKKAPPASQPPQQQAAQPIQAQQSQPMETSPSSPQPSTSGEKETEGATAEGGGGGGDLKLEDKVERAKELMDKVKEKKEQEEFEKRRNEELERRRQGADLQKLQQGQKETARKELRDQMKRDKEEEKKAKELVKAQIARDREERATRYKKEKDDREKNQEDAKKAKLMEKQKEAAELEAQRCETARIQVRLPDGSALTQNFEATDTFQSLRNVAMQRVGGSVTLSTTYPKRTFTGEDDSKSFRELQLVPSAVVMALPCAGAMASPSWSVGDLLTMLFSPLTWVWKLFTSLFYGSGAQSGAQGAGRGGAGGRQSSQSTEGGAASTNRGNRPTSAYQRRGMGRLSDLKDDDEDMATYNGNSTQQQ